MLCLKCLLPINSGESYYGMHSDCFSKWFQVQSTVTFKALMRRSSTSSSDNKNISSSPQNNSFFQGKFKKYSAVLDGRQFIFKMRQDEAPELPEVEYLCNQIGAELGVPLAKFYIINFEEELVFVTENFIQHATPMDLQHIYHFRDSDQHNCKDLISIVNKYTKKPYYVQVLIKTILFDALIGNHDRHGRNLGFIQVANEMALSPIYDNVSYLGLENGNMLKADFNPTGKIATSLSYEPSMQDYVLELNNLGFQKEVNDFYRTIKLKKIEALIDNSFCSLLMKQALKKLITKRYIELKNEYKLKT